MSMRRRIFLAGALGAASGPPLAAATPIPSVDRFADAARIGRAILKADVVESDAAALRAALGISRDTSFPFGRTWAQAIRDDYANGRTVHVSGWVLCRTEARLCALAAKTQRADGAR